MMMINVVLMGIAAYLIGAIPTGVLVSRCLRNIDLQRAGSGNIGAANALDVMGPVPGLLVFAGDFGKGLLVLTLTRKLGFAAGVEIWMGLLAVTGHIFPVYLRFRGGKGLSTALAVALWRAPAAVLLFLLVWGVFFLFTRHIATSSLAGTIGVAVYAAFYGILAGVLTALLIAGRHVPETWAFIKGKLSPS